MMSRMSRRRGSARMLRLPSARAPHSMRPWNQPTTSPSASRAAVARHSAASSSSVVHVAAALLDDAAVANHGGDRRPHRTRCPSTSAPCEGRPAAYPRSRATRRAPRRARCRCRRPPAGCRRCETACSCGSCRWPRCSSRSRRRGRARRPECARAPRAARERRPLRTRAAPRRRDPRDGNRPARSGRRAGPSNSISRSV